MYIEKVAHNSRTDAHWVHVLGVHVLFSYETPVAFATLGEQLRRNNDWGATTGKHMNLAGVRQYPVEEDASKFNDRLTAAIEKAAMESFKARLA